MLTSLGVSVAARTYRAWKAARTLSARTLAMVYLMNAIHALAFVLDPLTGKYRLRPEGLYGRRKMTAALRRAGHEVSFGRVHTAMTMLGHHGVTRTRKVRTTVPGKDGHRAGDLLNRDFTAPAPNLVWVTDFTYVRSWEGFCYVALRPTDRRLARPDDQDHRPGDDPAEDGPVGTRPPSAPAHTRAS